MTKNFSIHVDHPWSKCVQEDGAPKRIYIHLFRIFITIALAPGEGGQVYDWRHKKWTQKWSWITITPY